MSVSYIRVAVPLLAAASLALAAVAPRPAAATPRLGVSLTETPIVGGDQYDYTVSDGNTYSGYTISEIWIPELHAGDLMVGTLPTGWTATETIPGAQSNISIVGNTKGAQIFLQTSTLADEIPAGGSDHFIFTSPYNNTLLSTWLDYDQAGSGNTGGTTPIPDSSNPVAAPEPGSVAILAFGLFGLGAAARRRHGISAKPR